MPPKKSEEQKAAEAAAKMAAAKEKANAKEAARIAKAVEKAAKEAARAETRKLKAAATAARKKSQKRGSNSNTSEGEGAAVAAPARSRAERAAAVAAAREARAADAKPAKEKGKLMAFCLKPDEGEEEEKLPGGRVVLKCIRTIRGKGPSNAEVAFQPYFKTDADDFKLYHLCKGAGKSAGVARHIYGLDDRAIYRCYTKGYATKGEATAIATQGEFAKEEGSPESLKSSKAEDENDSDSDSDSEGEGQGMAPNPFGEDEEGETTPKPGPAARIRSAGPATRLRSLGNGIGNLVKFKRRLTRKLFNSPPKTRQGILSLRALRGRSRTPARNAAPAPTPVRNTRKAKSRTPSPKRGTEKVDLRHVIGEARGPVGSFLAEGSVAAKKRAFDELAAKLAAEAARAPVSSLKKGPSAP